ncbi:MAG TPA: AbrB/MazE/SpoVT family DNA-binding domain-containing protein [Candidatus Kaiserbacteria bacterium]|nr:AbrB/MazE/SpoVT family DNA-binding domain-containing protein [Candidatus Kaiserbacteria bacterium]
MKSIQKIQKVTERGQITLPIEWRRAMKTKYISIDSKGDSIIINPVSYTKKDIDEYTVFDAIRDNSRKGLRASELQKILKKIDG